MRTVVIDTNVLLSDPGVIDRFRDTDVVIPEMVLAEIDKLKTARVDPDLRFRGRQISRALFELSEFEARGFAKGDRLRLHDERRRGRGHRS